MNIKFPCFENIDLKHNKLVKEFVSKHPPYSDFNFVSMYTYNKDGNSISMSMLNDNLVLRFLDYETNKPFYTFLGSNKIENTIKILMDKSIEEGIDPILGMIPETVINNISLPMYNVSEDINNFDYIFSLDFIADLSSSAFKKHRNLVTTFIKKYPDYKFEEIDFNLKDNIKHTLDLCDLWYANKKDNSHSFDRERDAIVRAITNAQELNLICLGIWIDDKLQGFSISEMLNDSIYAIAHYRKANIKYTGIYQFLENQTAKYLRNLGGEFINFEQDLGDTGLRISKSLWHPVTYLKKYTISHKK